LNQPTSAKQQGTLPFQKPDFVRRDTDEKKVKKKHRDRKRKRTIRRKAIKVIKDDT
jgi:hypothetical protein